MNTRVKLKKFIISVLFLLLGFDLALANQNMNFDETFSIIYMCILFFLLGYILMDEDSVQEEIKEKDKRISEKNTEINSLEYKITQLERNNNI
jgi:hypothetical protein